jgi:glycosyltransferase involved in cell wall biosynthesis
MRIKKREKMFFIHSHNALMSMTCFHQTHLFTVHDALYYQNKAVLHKLKNIFYLLEKFLYTRTHFVHFISQFTKKMSLFSKKTKFIIIYNTSHLETLEINPKDKSESIIEFSADKIKVFVVRSMEKRSRIDLVIKVATELKDHNFEIFVAGKGILFNFYQNQIKKLNLKNLQLLGYESDRNLISYYKACDIVLMPAEYAEGFGLPIIEGYLFNKPVIASKRCAIPEVIIDEEFLFENNVESIINKLEFAEQKSKENYYGFYLNTFSNTQIISQFKTLYKDLM